MPKEGVKQQVRTRTVHFSTLQYYMISYNISKYAPMQLVGSFDKEKHGVVSFQFKWVSRLAFAVLYNWHFANSISQALFVKYCMQHLANTNCKALSAILCKHYLQNEISKNLQILIAKHYLQNFTNTIYKILFATLGKYHLQEYKLSFFCKCHLLICHLQIHNMPILWKVFARAFRKYYFAKYCLLQKGFAKSVAEETN